MDTYNNPVYSFTPDALQLVGAARLAYVRKVYSYFGLGLLTAIAGSLIAMNSELVFFMARSPIIGMLLFIGMVMLASKSAANPKAAVPTLMAATFVSGLVISPLLYAIAHNYLPGSGVNTIYNALIITSTVYVGLTSYVFVTKKDFSTMGATLMVGLFMILGLGIANIFMQSSTLDLALAGVTAILFSGFILYDTSKILRNAHEIPPTQAALNLFLDFLNLFMAILRLLTGGRGRN